MTSEPLRIRFDMIDGHTYIHCLGCDKQLDLAKYARNLVREAAGLSFTVHCPRCHTKMPLTMSSV